MNTEILINAFIVTHDDLGDSYEFVLNDELKVTECIQLHSDEDKSISQISNAGDRLEGSLFELNHVRVNPRVDNTYIIECLTNALHDIGVQVYNAPESDSMALCFKPLGEISDNVRFYLNPNNKVTFLSPSTRPRLISC